MNFNRRNSRKNNKLNTLKYKIYCSLCLFLAILHNGKFLILKRLRFCVGIENIWADLQENINSFWLWVEKPGVQGDSVHTFLHSLYGKLYNIFMHYFIIEN